MQVLNLGSVFGVLGFGLASVVRVGDGFAVAGVGGDGEGAVGDGASVRVADGALLLGVRSGSSEPDEMIGEAQQQQKAISASTPATPLVASFPPRPRREPVSGADTEKGPALTPP
ncbi:MAG: hypothetical protein FWJ65_11190 [Limnochordales bacterium]